MNVSFNGALIKYGEGKWVNSNRIVDAEVSKKKHSEHPLLTFSYTKADGEGGEFSFPVADESHAGAFVKVVNDAKNNKDSDKVYDFDKLNVMA